jgi:hypothetical protein
MLASPGLSPETQAAKALARVVSDIKRGKFGQ